MSLEPTMARVRAHEHTRVRLFLGVCCVWFLAFHLFCIQHQRKRVVGVSSDDCTFAHYSLQFLFENTNTLIDIL